MRGFYLLIALSLFSGRLYCQDLLWENTIGGSDQDWLNHSFQNQQGNYVFSGYSYSDISGDKTEASRGAGDFWILETDPQGDILWQKTLGGNGQDAIVATLELDAQVYVMAGESYSGVSGEKTQPVWGDRDLWLVKMDAQRNIVWQQNYGGTGIETLFDIISTSDGGFLVSSYSDSPISGEKTTETFGGTDLWLLKLDRDGQLEWQQSFGGDGNELFGKLLETGKGTFLLSATSYSGATGNKTEPSRGQSDGWILELDSQGNILWQRTIGGTSADAMMDVIPALDGGYILAGESSSGIGGDKSVPRKAATDLWVIKIDPQGNILWQNTYAGDVGEWFSAIVPSTSGYLLSAMSYSGTGNDKTEPSRGDRDYWMLKIDLEGAVCWDKTLGGSSVDQPMDAFEDSEGNFIVGGWSDSEASGDKTENSNGGRDFWITKIDPPAIQAPIANIPETIMACDQNGDGFTEFDLEGVHEEILGGQQNVVVSYFDENWNPLPSPLPDKYTNSVEDREHINVILKNRVTRCAITQFQFLLEVGCDEEGDGDGGGHQEKYAPYFPKFFTPNGDGYNDTWKPQEPVASLVNYVYIFDRYGKLLKRLGRNESWNGEFNGRPMPSDDYWFRSESTTLEKITGHFSLIRQ